MNAKIIQKMFDICGFDPTNKSFSGTLSLYEWHRVCENVLKISESYDIDNVLSILYLHYRLDILLKDTRIDMYKYCSNKDYRKNVDDIDSLYRDLHTDIIQSQKDELIKALNRLLASSTNKSNLISTDSNDIEALNILCESIVDICENLSKLEFRVFNKGFANPVINKYYENLIIKNTLAEVLLSIETMPDGCYCYYIMNNNTVNGYFGYMVKSNGWLISYDESTTEMYVGQSDHRRNVRDIADSKVFEIFPYSLINTDSPDYKGYYTKYSISAKNDINIGMLEYSEYLKIILSVMLLHNNIERRDLSNVEILYVDSLTPYTVNELKKEIHTTALVKTDSNIIKNTNKLRFNITRNNIVYGTIPEGHKLVDKYGHEIKVLNEYQDFIDAYIGDDFTIDESDFLNSLSYKMIGNTEDVNYNFEISGTYDNLFTHQYFNLRKKLYKYITDKINRDAYSYYDNVINTPENKYYHEREYMVLRSYFNKLYLNNYQNIINYILDSYIDTEISKNSSSSSIQHEYFKEYENIMISTYNQCWNTLNEKDLFNDKRCNMYFHVEPKNGKGLELLLNKTDLPMHLKLYKRDKKYHGNSILNLIDPIGNLETPWSMSKSFLSGSFAFAFGFSKQSFNKLLNERKKYYNIK